MADGPAPATIRSTEDLPAALARARPGATTELRLDLDRDGCLRALRRIRREADVIVRLDGLTGETLQVYAEAVCDFAVDAAVPIEFEHRGVTLQLRARSPGGAAAGP